MSLPNIKFNVSKNGLGRLVAQVEKIPAMILFGITVEGDDKVTEGQSYQIFSLPEAETLGIEAAGDNEFAHKQISDFYKIAGAGAELWFMITQDGMHRMAELENDYATKLLSDAKGKIRVIGLADVQEYPGGDEALNTNVIQTVINAQALCEDFEKRYNHVRAVVSGNYFTGNVADLRDYSLDDYNKVSILLSNNDGSNQASIGLLLGRIASIPTQRKISRVKDGPIEPLNAYFTNGAPVETLATAWDAIHNKGYIFLRSFANRSGYYFSSDKTLTKPNDDFNTLARGLVMDEAILICYDTMVEELSDEVPATESGKIHPAIVKGWQNAIERQINGLMVNVGKLSAVRAFIDENQNFLSTDNIDIQLQLLPVGYSDYITVNIGFTTNLE